MEVCFMVAAVVLPVLAVGAYRLGLRDGLWQSGRSLPGPGGKKKNDPSRKKPLAQRVEEF